MVYSVSDLRLPCSPSVYSFNQSSFNASRRSSSFSLLLKKDLFSRTHTHSLSLSFYLFIFGCMVLFMFPIIYFYAIFLFRAEFIYFCFKLIRCDI